MKAPRIDQPLRLGLGFLWVYLVSLGLFLWKFPPWSWQEPALTEISGALVVPFLAAMAVYCTFLFIYSLVTNFSEQRAAFGLFLIIVAAQLVAEALVYAFPSLPRIRWYIPFAGSVIFAVACRPLVRMARRRRAKSSSLPNASPLEGDVP